jgi:hypothetical protein
MPVLARTRKRLATWPRGISAPNSSRAGPCRSVALERNVLAAFSSRCTPAAILPASAPAYQRSWRQGATGHPITGESASPNVQAQIPEIPETRPMNSNERATVELRSSFDVVCCLTFSNSETEEREHERSHLSGRFDRRDHVHFVLSGAALRWPPVRRALRPWRLPERRLSCPSGGRLFLLAQL